MLLKMGIAIAIVTIALARSGGDRISSSTYEIASARIGKSFDGYCVVQISDLHNQLFGFDHSHLIETVRAAHPDLIAVTGDLTYRGRWRADYARGLALRLVALAPVYFVTGNHDIASKDLPGLLKLLEDSGVHVLAGRSVFITRGNRTIVLGGIDDPRFYRNSRNPRASTIERWTKDLVALRDSERPLSFTLLLSHRPELLKNYANVGFDLVLAGHAHGGQIRLPVIGAIYAPDQGWFPSYTSGVYSLAKTQMVVSRGLGRSAFPTRFLNPPELVIVHLKSQSN